MFYSKKEHKQLKNIKADWSFQEDAAQKVSQKFLEDLKSRFLVVIPTGGGKTITALKIIDLLIKKGEIGVNNKVLWVVHTLALKSQTERVINNINSRIKKYNFHKDLSETVVVSMLNSAARLVQESNNYGLIVIDEAHHAAADSYLQFFETNLGILGLTATPARTDDRNLDFDDVAFSITFRELVKRNVIVLPRFYKESTDITVNVNNLKDENLNQFDRKERNHIVAKYIFKYIHDHNLKKVIVFAGTNAHVENLYKEIKKINDNAKEKFPHVGFVYGGDNNEKGLSNEEYLEWHKTQQQSILVNCRLLNEGYDDPDIDCVVMATPTNSILYYMQCIGRAVRNSNSYSSSDNTVVLELTDKLPNVHYRIDNRWLFSEISDYLEPEVIDVRYYWKFHYKLILKKILKEHNVKMEDSKFFSYVELFRDETSMLLFNELADNPNSKWKIIFFGGLNKYKYVNIFNTISNSIEYFVNRNYDHTLFGTRRFNFNLSKDDVFFGDRTFRASFFMALKNANSLKESNKKVNCLKYYVFIRNEKIKILSIIEIIKLLLKK